MFEEMIRPGKALPDYARSDHFDVFLTLPGELRNADLLRFLNRIGLEEADRFDSHDLLVLRDAAIGDTIPATLRDRAGLLAERGFLGKSRGGKFILARKYARTLAAATGQRPRDAAYNKLLAAIEEHRVAGCTMEQLVAVAPEFSRSTIKRVLDELRQDGKTHPLGGSRTTRWFPGPA